MVNDSTFQEERCRARGNAALGRTRGTSIAEAVFDTGLLESMQPTLGDDVNYYLGGGCEREK